MSYDVQPLRNGDLQSVTDIFNAACHARESTHGMRPWTIEQMEQFLFEARPVFESYTCIDDGAVVGWTALTRHHVREGYRHTAELSLYVKHSARRKGIGSALAQTLLNRASALELHCILAIVFKDTPHVVSFAENKLGFVSAACLPDAFPGKEQYFDILVLEKMIEAN
jgi:L-amino acid N-acyltransferase YncA